MITRMVRRAAYLLVIPAFLACFSTAFAEETTTDLYGAEYFPAIHKEFQNAKESIVVAMYMIRVYPQSTKKSPTFVLVRDLIEARTRGVEVTVILANEYRRHTSSEARKVKQKRVSTVEMLTEGGVTVRYVSVRRVLHEKLIIIDGETVVCGSHNWSDMALKYNIESTLLVRSEKLAKRKLKQIAELELLPEPPAAEEGDASLSVPVEFLTRHDLAHAMLKESDGRAFDLYLFLLRQGSEFSLKHRSAAESLGLDVSDRTAYRREITRKLRKLQDHYGLIECTFHHATDTDVRIPRKKNGGASIRIPIAYWDYGWHRTLSLSAKSAYLICLAQADTSPGKPWWSASGEKLAGKYPGGRDTIVAGLRELEKLNLLEIVRSSPPPGKPYSHRRPNSYRLKPLLSREDIQTQWDELAGEYGNDQLEIAREWAGRMDRMNTPGVVADILMLRQEYPPKLVEKAVNHVAGMAPDNPCRHVGYIVTLLKDWSRRGRAVMYISSRKSDRFHNPECRYAKAILKTKEAVTYNRRMDAVKDGKSPCKTCRP